MTDLANPAIADLAERIETASGGTITPGLALGLRAVTPALGDEHPVVAHLDGNALDLHGTPEALTAALDWFSLQGDVVLAVLADDVLHVELERALDLSSFPKAKKKKTAATEEPAPE
jgi:hypothetical protein